MKLVDTLFPFQALIMCNLSEDRDFTLFTIRHIKFYEYFDTEGFPSWSFLITLIRNQHMRPFKYGNFVRQESLLAYSAYLESSL